MDTDFQDYISQLAESQNEAEQGAEMLRQHEIWRQTTLIGQAVQFLQKVGDNPFTHAVTAAFKRADSEKSVQMIVLRNVIRLSIIAIVIMVFFVFGKVVQIFIGKTIEMEQVVEIVEEVPRSMVEKLEQAETLRNRRGARDKQRKGKLI